MSSQKLKKKRPSEETIKAQRCDKSIIERTIGGISTHSKSTQFALGSISGCVTGYTFMKIGKVLAGALGGGILILQFANLYGYININWHKVNKKVSNMSGVVDTVRRGWIDRVIDVAKMSFSFNAGFLGGFFIAVSCA